MAVVVVLAKVSCWTPLVADNWIVQCAKAPVNVRNGLKLNRVRIVVALDGASVGGAVEKADSTPIRLRLFPCSRGTRVSRANRATEREGSRALSAKEPDSGTNK